MFVTLQIGRGLAAIAVAAFHMSIVTGSPKFGGNGERVLWDWVGRGHLGVDFFFVLSGFIILQAHRHDIDTPSRVGRYALRRATRIFPIYWVYLTACIVGMAIVGSQFLALRTAGDWITVYALIRFTDVGLPLAQAWTLFHEMVFYSAFALLVYNRRLGMAVFAAWLVAVLYFFYYPPNSTQNFADTILGAYNLNFFVGMSAALMAQRIHKTAAVALLLGGIALFAFVYQLGASLVTPSIAKLAFAFSFGAVVSGAAALERLGSLVPPTAWGFIGDASYSIYLLHEHVQTYSVRALLQLGVKPAEHGASVFWLVMAITVLVGCLAYQWLERPMLTWLRRRFESDRTGRSPLVIEGGSKST